MIQEITPSFLLMIEPVLKREICVMFPDTNIENLYAENLNVGIATSMHWYVMVKRQFDPLEWRLPPEEDENMTSCIAEMDIETIHLQWCILLDAGEEPWAKVAWGYGPRSNTLVVYKDIELL